MKPTPLQDIPSALVEFNRERVKSELAQGIFDMMRCHSVNRTRLAELLGVQKSRVSHMLSGSHNFRVETLADVFLVLGRTPHLVLGTDLESVRFPVDEGSTGSASQTSTVTSIEPSSYPISHYPNLISLPHKTTSSSVVPGSPNTGGTTSTVAFG